MRQRFEIDLQMLNEAERIAKDMGSLNKSLMQGERNIIGILGELAYRRRYPEVRSTYNTKFMYDFDYWMDDIRVEVKSQQIRSWVPPDMHFPKTKEELTFDWLECFEIHESLTHGWYIGRMSKDKFDQVAEDIKAGDPMPQGGQYRSDGRRIWKQHLS